MTTPTPPAPRRPPSIEGRWDDAERPVNATTGTEQQDRDAIAAALVAAGIPDDQPLR